MSFYSLNRAAINAGVSSVIAGAALLVSTSAVEASATRVVLPESSAALGSNAQATGTRIVLGGGGFVTALSTSAFPALLQLQSADIYSSGSLKATYTDAWASQAFQLDATATVIRPGVAACVGLLSASAVPLVDVGFASNIVGFSEATADASVKRSGQSTTERDGYAKQTIYSGLVGSGLRTALQFANPVGHSTFEVVPTKIHGGEAFLPGVLSITAIASTDSAKAVFYSDMTALGVHTQAGYALAEVSMEVSADPTPIRAGSAEISISNGFLLVDGRLAELAEAAVVATSSCVASGTIIKLGGANSLVESFGSADWIILVDGYAAIEAQSLVTASAFTNAEAPDPVGRTMYRPFVDKVMRRPFVDRVMRRKTWES